MENTSEDFILRMYIKSVCDVLYYLFFHRHCNREIWRLQNNSSQEGGIRMKTA